MDPYSSPIIPSSSSHHSTSLAPFNDNHPSYSKMICSAISALKEKNGSSKKAIGKYIEQEYKDLLPPNHETLLTQNLNYLKEKNILIMVKRSYKFPSPKPNDSKSAPQLDQNVEPKSTQLGLNDKGEVSSSAGGATTEVKKMGQDRSPKVSGNVEGVSSTLRLGNGKRVRHPPTKYESFLPLEIISDDLKRKPGRLPKAHVNPVAIPSAPRSNDGGAPPPAGALGLTQLPSNSISIGSPNPRGGCGRKHVPVWKMIKKSIGKPVGLPKVSKKEEDIEADLRNKIRFIQSRVRRSVTVLRTYFHMKSPIVARAAIHDLETLGRLDIDLPLLSEDTPPPPPVQSGKLVRRPMFSMIFGRNRLFLK